MAHNRNTTRTTYHAAEIAAWSADANRYRTWVKSGEIDAQAGYELIAKCDQMIDLHRRMMSLPVSVAA
jgi:hypothetical protein